MKRLKAIEDYSMLGAGFRIAMRDLEIRGAGNLLGTGQSGHVSAVGYDLYCQMVNEAVAELNGEPVKVPAEIKIELPVDAHLPSDYIGREDLRIEAYRRLAAVEDPQTVSDIRTEWVDRYGPVPAPAEALLDVAMLRAQCHRTGVREVTVVKSPAFSKSAYVARLTPLPLKTSQAMKVQRLFKGAVVKADIEQVQLPLAKASTAAAVLVEALGSIVPASEAAPEPTGPSESGPASRRAQ